jgi:2-phosphoglycerate kinase
MNNNERNWTVLFIGGASGTGKSTLAYELANFYKVNILEVDDIMQALKASTTISILPVIHNWSTGINWMDIGIAGNLNWLKNVGKEMIPALKAVAERHIKNRLPIIIEGDFIYPEFTFSLKNPQIRCLYAIESDKNQIIQNFLAKESGDYQSFKAEISLAYEEWIKNECNKIGIKYIESRPWENLLERVIEIIK